MKTLIIILFTFSSFVIKAQMPHPAGSYTQNPELDKFVGTWQWVSGNDTIKIVLQKQKIYYQTPMDYWEDRLVGWHKYVKNGSVVETDLMNAGALWSWQTPVSQRPSLFGSTDGPNKIYFIKLRDLTKNKQGEMRFKLLPGSLTQASWELRNTRGLKAAPYDWSFTMPEDLIFTKQ